MGALAHESLRHTPSPALKRNERRDASVGFQTRCTRGDSKMEATAPATPAYKPLGGKVGWDVANAWTGLAAAALIARHFVYSDRGLWTVDKADLEARVPALLVQAAEATEQPLEGERDVLSRLGMGNLEPRAVLHGSSAFIAAGKLSALKSGDLPVVGLLRWDSGHALAIVGQKGAPYSYAIDPHGGRFNNYTGDIELAAFVRNCSTAPIKTALFFTPDPSAHEPTVVSMEVEQPREEPEPLVEEEEEEEDGSDANTNQPMDTGEEEPAEEDQAEDDVEEDLLAMLSSASDPKTRSSSRKKPGPKRRTRTTRSRKKKKGE